MQPQAVLFVKDLERAAAFYAGALGMSRVAGDASHAVLDGGWRLVVHRIPDSIAATITIADPPVRRVGGAIRLDYVVPSIAKSRRLALALGGGIDEKPPPWAEPGTNFFLGFDTEGNQFGVSEEASAR